METGKRLRIRDFRVPQASFEKKKKELATGILAGKRNLVRLAVRVGSPRCGTVQEVSCANKVLPLLSSLVVQQKLLGSGKWHNCGIVRNCVQLRNERRW